MRIGVFHFPTDNGINIAELAHALEKRGFDPLYVRRHTHTPTKPAQSFSRRRRTAEEVLTHA